MPRLQRKTLHKTSPTLVALVGRGSHQYRPRALTRRFAVGAALSANDPRRLAARTAGFLVCFMCFGILFHPCPLNLIEHCHR